MTAPASSPSRYRSSQEWISHQSNDSLTTILH
ncbi:hypothetical protein [Paenibacillus polymyxa]